MTVRILTGDCRDVLRTLEADSVDCVITSPPYWGLRDYGTATWEGGDPDCEHTGVARRCDKPGRTDKQSTQKGSSSDRVSRTCLLCGADRVDSQIGLERSLDEYLAQMVAVFSDVRRVLRKDGTLWLNLGDTYASGGRKTRDPGQSKIHPAFEGDSYADGLRQIDPHGIKPKDLIGVPWMIAFALRADGWYLRQDIIWAKPNPMPESVTDRCTKAHEYIFLLSKSERYHFDQDAILEPCQSGESDLRKMAESLPRIGGKHKDLVDPLSKASAATNIGQKRSVGGASRSARDNFRREGSKREQPIPGQSVGTHRPDRADSSYDTAHRNKRSVWTIATQGFSEAHFATFPPALVEPCILAGCPPGGTVLDPFGGAGTVGLVADRLGRSAILIELNPAYADMASKRVEQDCPMFAQVTA